MIDLNKIEYHHWNERDIEGPVLIDFIKNHPDIDSLLDVGVHWAWSYYAPEVKNLVRHYVGIDILPDPQTAAIVDEYIVGNVLEKRFAPFDMVACISSIEHSGITTYKVEDYKAEQLKVFKKLLESSKKYLFLTFPFGKDALHEGQFANISLDQYSKFIALAKKTGLVNIESHFYFSSAPQEKQPYRDVDLEFAQNVEYQPELGTRCFCVLTIEKV